MGRVGVIGGSADYTGAPYYAAAACLRFGADLAYVFSAKQAVIPIKCYSPEVIVTAFYDDELAVKICPPAFSEGQVQSQDGHAEEGAEAAAAARQMFMDGAARMSSVITASLPRVHSLIVGPGLGRNAQVLQAVLLVLQQVRMRQPELPVVVDADALWMLAQGHNLLAVRGLPQCILTPNLMEFGLLVNAALRLVRDGSLPVTDRDTEAEAGAEAQAYIAALSSKFSDVRLRALAGLLQLTVLLKGPVDLVCGPSGPTGPTAVDPRKRTANDKGSSSAHTYSSSAASALAQDVFEVSEAGSPRRCGGQGDVLSGAVGVAAHWANARAAHFQSLSVDINSGGGGGGDDDDEEVDALSQKAKCKATVRLQPPVLAAILASLVTRRAAQYAFQDKRRAMGATDLLHSLGTAFEAVVDDEDSHSQSHLHSPYSPGSGGDEY